MTLLCLLRNAGKAVNRMPWAPGLKIITLILTGVTVKYMMRGLCSAAYPRR